MRCILSSDDRWLAMQAIGLKNEQNEMAMVCLL